MLSLIVDNAVTSMEGKAACLFLADEREDIFVAKAQAGLLDKYIHASKMQAHKIVAALEKDGYLAFAIQNASMFLELEKDKKSLEEDIWSYRSCF